jgi:hypothetical protein
MGLAHSPPSIVMNGLVLCLDAANSKSYPGSGTTWTDLSGNVFNLKEETKMGVFAGPEIAESGLVLALDAGNSKSYPTTGTTWTDLSGNGNTGIQQSTLQQNFNATRSRYSI